MYKNKVILITGGTGSWGNELTKQLLDKDIKKIIIFSRGELAQVEMQRKFKDDRLEFMIGDIRDKEALEEATIGVDYIFHLAALKHVPVCEKQAQEVIKTNIIGTMTVSYTHLRAHETVLDLVCRLLLEKKKKNKYKTKKQKTNHIRERIITTITTT